MGAFIEKIEQEIEGISSPLEKLYVLVKTHFSALAADPHMAVVTQLELRQSNKELRHRINEVLKGYLRLIDRIIMEGMEKGEFRQDLDVRLTRQMIFGTLDETVTTWVMNEQKYDLAALAEPVYELLVKRVRRRALEQAERGEASWSSFRIAKEEFVAVVTFSRPPANALASAVLKELSTLLDELETDPDVRVVLLHGEGRVFLSRR